MLYLEHFSFPATDKRLYPFGIMHPKQIGKLDFTPVTIFYGGNGSGKSTILNIIARTIGVRDMTLGNTGDYFDSYIEECSYYLNWRNISRKSRFIRSEDIMDGINDARETNFRITQKTYKDADKLDEYGFEGLSERFFDQNLTLESLIFLDEPENSLDAISQQQLAIKIDGLAHYADTQFIIATHSPFLMAIRGAKVVDLDSTPSIERNWYELPNMVAYFNFFQKHADKFQE
jgi:predicted ATPase